MLGKWCGGTNKPAINDETCTHKSQIIKQSIHEDEDGKLHTSEEEARLPTAKERGPVNFSFSLLCYRSHTQIKPKLTSSANLDHTTIIQQVGGNSPSNLLDPGFKLSLLMDIWILPDLA